MPTSPTSKPYGARANDWSSRGKGKAGSPALVARGSPLTGPRFQVPATPEWWPALDPAAQFTAPMGDGWMLDATQFDLGMGAASYGYDGTCMWDPSLNNHGMFGLEPMMEEFTLGESVVSKGKGKNREDETRKGKDKKGKGEKGRAEKGKGKGEKGKAAALEAEPLALKGKERPKAKAKPKADDLEEKVNAFARAADEDGDVDPNVPSIGWTLIWCDETAFKSNSLQKKKQLESLGLRVKAHKTAERCIRSLDKRSKKHIYSPAETQPRVIALVTTDNYDLVSYLRERPFLARNLVLFGEQSGDVERKLLEEPDLLSGWDAALSRVQGIVAEAVAAGDVADAQAPGAGNDDAASAEAPEASGAPEKSAALAELEALVAAPKAKAKALAAPKALKALKALEGEDAEGDATPDAD